MADYRFYLDRLLTKKRNAANPLLQYLVAGWKLDGNADDIKGLNNGNVTGQLTSVEGKFGDAYTGWSIDNHIKITRTPEITLGGDVTISCWINRQNADIITNQSIFSLGILAGVAIGYGFRVGNTNNIYFDVRNLSTLVTNVSSFTIPQNTWVNIVGVISKFDNISTIYIHDQPAINTNISNVTDYTPNQDYGIGARFNGSFVGFPISQNTIIDEVLIFNKALTADEVQILKQGI